ncbi:disease resistance protein RPV1-like isoform X2 [Macadamia integrifolia]|nr:disease resistance protein RPV1-like isoform X2 [Macadamia integrifolia]
MVLSELKKTSLVITDFLVGIQDHIKKMVKLLDVSSREVRIVGIHGIGGIGKTTIAKAIYNEISCHFENCSFLEDVRETCQQHKGLVQLQKQLIANILKRKDVDITSVDEGVNMIKERCCNKKVLIVLDDVDNLDQLRKLAHKRDWFGLGSRIIITTRDKHILNGPEVDEMYEPCELDCSQSFKLFSMHAFRRDRPPADYMDISIDVAQTAGGIPLAVEVIGSYLSGKNKAVWEDTLKKLRKIPHDQVQKKLRISYDGLDNEQKQIFLDIACFFIGMSKRIAVYFWDACGYFPQEGIDILLLRSLVKIGVNDELKMHSQLRDLGREIVRRENFQEPGERSRLWFHDEAWDVLKTCTGTRKVEGLRVGFGNGSEKNIVTNEEFAEMSKLRFLQIDYVIIAGDLKHHLSKLRWLSWKGCPYNFTPTNFHPEKLVVLDLSRSKVTEDWEGWNQMKMAKKLKVINLSGCYDLIKTPEFLPFPLLEELILEDCSNLVEIDTSIGYLKCLVFLNLKDCKSLVDLPISICGLNSLESLIMSGCTKLSRLPAGLDSLKALRELQIDETSIGQLSDSIALPKNLEILSARNCGFLTVLPTLIGRLRFLTDLALDKSQIVVLPDSIGSLLKLRRLSLRDCRSLRKIPDSIGQLESLVELNLIDAVITELPDSIGHLKSLIDVQLDGTQIIELPESVGLLVNLEKLSLSGCRSLRKIPDSIARLGSLDDLNLSRTGITEIPDAIGELKSLTDLKLGGTQIIELPDYWIAYDAARLIIT